jgi:acetoin:2,6-dichlorophenolindophenol oxidoreductase subunit beta
VDAVTTKMRMNQAVAAALADAMREDSDVVVFGEDVALAGGPFKTSDGLLQEFGPARVRDTPISEMGFVGIGVGAAATGLRPVVDMMFVEFLGVALDQLSTEAAKYRYLSGGALTVPLTVRASAGAGLGFGAQHSQTLETWFTATPGLKLAVASGARTAYGLVRAAIRDDNPVVVLEPRALYGSREEVVTGEEGVIPLGVAERLREGGDLTVVATGRMVGVATAAIDGADVTADVLDLRTLMPWDREAVLASVRHTGRLAVVEENPFTGGWGTEIASYVASHAWADLRAPVLRITAPDVPVPFTKPLEDRYAPWPDHVAKQVTQLCDTGRLPAPWWEEEGVTGD